MTLKKIHISDYSLNTEIAFHDKETTDGLTRLAKDESILKLFKSISIAHPQCKLTITHLQKTRDSKDEWHLNCCFEIELLL